MSSSEPATQALWTGTARSVWAVPVFVGLVAGGMATALMGNPPFGAFPIFISLLALPFTSIRATADRRNVHIAYGAIGWPHQTFALTDIRQASAVNVVPLKHGGWGYRGSLKLFGRASIVLRGGEGIRLDLVGDRVLTITVDEAQVGASLINDLIAAQTAARSRRTA